MMKINQLPDEILLKFYQRLPPSTMKQVVLVDKRWKAVGGDPSLWKTYTVIVYSKDDIKNLSIKRLQRIEELTINPDNWDAEDWESFFHTVMELSKLKKIDGLFGAGDVVNFVEPSLFARSLAKLEDVGVRGCTDDHIQALFSEMSVSTKIKKLHLSSCHLSKLEPGLFGKVLSMLEELDLGNSDFTKEQIQVFFAEIINNSSLKTLTLIVRRRLSLEPGLFARALLKVEDVHLDFHGRTSDLPLGTLFSELTLGTHQLRRLDLCGGNFSQMEPSLFAHALSKLEELRLARSYISHGQVQALFTVMSHQTQMKKLALHLENLSQLEVGLFARVMARMEDVVLLDVSGLWKYYVTARQMVAFFNEVSANSHLKTLKISNVDLSNVDPEVFVKAVTRLEAITIKFSVITNDQVVSLFSQMSQNMLLKKMDLHETNLSSVCSQDFARSLNRLEELSMCRVGFTHEQVVAFFSEMARNTQLKKLKLEADDLSPDDLFIVSVDPEVLGNALTKLKEVDLSGSNLSTEQIASIFKYVLQSEKKLKKLHLSYKSAGAQVDPEIMNKVKEKLKGELELTARDEMNTTDELDSSVEVDNCDIADLIDG